MPHNYPEIALSNKLEIILFTNTTNPTKFNIIKINVQISLLLSKMA